MTGRVLHTNLQTNYATIAVDVFQANSQENLLSKMLEQADRNWLKFFWKNLVDGVQASGSENSENSQHDSVEQLQANFSEVFSEDRLDALHKSFHNNPGVIAWSPSTQISGEN